MHIRYNISKYNDWRYGDTYDVEIELLNVVSLRLVVKGRFETKSTTTKIL